MGGTEGTIWLDGPAVQLQIDSKGGFNTGVYTIYLGKATLHVEFKFSPCGVEYHGTALLGDAGHKNFGPIGCNDWTYSWSVTNTGKESDGCNVQLSGYTTPYKSEGESITLYTRYYKTFD